MIMIMIANTIINHDDNHNYNDLFYRTSALVISRTSIMKECFHMTSG